MDKISNKISNPVFNITTDVPVAQETFNVVDFEGNQVIDSDANTIVGEG